MSTITGTTIEYETKKHGEITSAYTYNPFFTAWRNYTLDDSNANTLCRWASPTQTINLQVSDSTAYIDLIWLYGDAAALDKVISVTDDENDTLNVITKLDIQKYKLVIDGFYIVHASVNGESISTEYKTAGYQLQENEYIRDYVTHWEAKDNPNDSTSLTIPVIRYTVNDQTWYFEIPDMFPVIMKNNPRNNQLKSDLQDVVCITGSNIALCRSPINSQGTWTYPGLGKSFVVSKDGDFTFIFSNPSEQQNVVFLALNSVEAMLKSVALLGVYFEYDGTMYLGYMDGTGQTTGDYLTEDNWQTSAQWNSESINNFTEHTEPVTPPVNPEDKELDMSTLMLSGSAGMVHYYEINKTGTATANQISDAISRFDISTIGKDLMRNMISFKAFAVLPTSSVFNNIIHVAGKDLKDENDNYLTGDVILGMSKLSLGTIAIPTLYNDYRDYEPYTRIEMFVPFCGWFALPSWAMGKTITGEMFVDLYNGTCKAIIKASGTVAAEIGGNVAYDIPFVAESTGAKAGAVISSALTTAVSAAGFAATPNIATGAAALSSAANLASAVNSNHTTLKGVLGDGSNVNGLNRCFIKVMRPMSPNGSTAIPDSYKHEIGVPTMKEITISAGDGYIQVTDAKVTGTMTAREKQMIVDGFRHGLNF